MENSMKSTILIPALLAFLISAALGPILIPILRRIKAGQTVRTDGPKSHLAKNGTPAMGGFIFILAICIVGFFYARTYTKLYPILFVTLGFAVIGFMDDYIKIVLKRSMGLRAWQKMLGQIVITVAFGVYLFFYSGVSTSVWVPFIEAPLNLGIFSIPIMVIAVLGTVNGANFTDGLDGLASTVTLVISIFFTIASVWLNADVEVITSALAGALIGFLLFNAHPAKVFMGDTGSLALGGFVVATAYMTQLPIFILFVGFIYLAEVLSVMIQVSYFKMTKGKRIFKMAPIHHHFELSGWKETKVVAVFAIITAFLSCIALLSLKI